MRMNLKLDLSKTKRLAILFEIKGRFVRWFFYCRINLFSIVPLTFYLHSGVFFYKRKPKK